MREPLISVENLSVSFGAFKAVDDVSFHANRGEILGIVGESGSGKSLTLRAIAGLLPPTAKVTGSISFDGTNLLSLGSRQLRAFQGRRISMIFQNPASHLDPLMRIGSQVAEPLRVNFGQNRRQSHDGAVDLLAEVGIQDPSSRARAYPHEFSGGMKQRALIAGVMACKPALLLADEPTTALDVTVQARILKLIRELQRDRDMTVIFVSHDLSVVSELCDRVVVMRRSRIVEQGTTRALVTQPRQDYTKLLIASQPSKLSFPVTSAIAQDQDVIASTDRLSVRFVAKPAMPWSKSKDVVALEDVSLAVRRGECFGVIGESGSGKSTLANVFTRLVTPASGTASFEGKDIQSLEGADLLAFRRSVQMVFQNPFNSLNPKMRIIDAVAEPLVRHQIANPHDARRQADAVLDSVELPGDLRGRRPTALSGGQCQRAAIARALILRPKLLIADEITSALDVTIQAQILKLLHRLRMELGLTIIYITHDLGVARNFCDRLAVFRNARLIEQGTAMDILTVPGHEYTRNLIESAPRLVGAEETI